MDKVKITNHQIFAITVCFTCGTSILVVSASAAGIAKQDSWISILLTLAFGLIEMWMLCFFWSRYPGMTYADMIEQLFGKWIGSGITGAFIFFCLLSDSQVIWYIGNFVTLQAMPETPAYFINMVFLVAVVIALLYGLEAILRSYEIFVYFVIFGVFICVFLISSNFNFDNLLPILEEGITPVLKGSLQLVSFILFPAILLLMVFPVNADNTKEARKSLFKGYLWGSIIIFISIVVPLLVLGSTITASSQFPIYITAKEINIGTIFTRLEFIVAGIWFITLLSRSIFYFYAGVVGLAQLLKLKDHKKIILPTGLIILVMSGVAYTDVIQQSDWDTLAWPPFVATFGFILPLMMMIVHYIRKILNKDMQKG